MASEIDPSRAGTALKFMLLVLVSVVAGWPINTLFAYAILLVAALVIFTGAVTTRRHPWVMAIAAGAVAVVLQFALSPQKIEEGHNAFLPSGKENVLSSGLPPEVYRIMAAQFDALHPRPQSCDVPRVNCPRERPLPDRTFAFSADGIFDKPGFSRRVDRIDVADPVWHRLGFINEFRYNWSPDDWLQRAQRDRRFWMGLHRWNLTMPYFVMYRFPEAFIGSQLCWRGDLIWEEGTDRFAPLSHAAWTCRPIEKEDAGRRIFALAIKPSTLALELEPSIGIWLRRLAIDGITIGAIVTILTSLVRTRTRFMLLPGALIAAGLLTIAIDDASFIGGVRPFDSGDDGLVYDSFARDILTSLLNGNVMQALEGGEKVFYFGGPGFRYLRALEHVVFGETYLGYLSLILLLPIAVFALFKRFVPRVWALACAIVFTAIPIGALFGTTFFQYAKNASRGYGDPAAAILAVCGTVVLVGWNAAGPSRRFAPAFGAALLLALAIFVRPNIAPYVGVIGAGAGIMALWHRQWARTAGLAAGILPAAFMPWHNWYFGNQFVLFSGNAQHAQIFLATPLTYIRAVFEFVTLDFAGADLKRAIVQIADWLGSTSESYFAIPIGAAAVAVVVFVIVRKTFDPWLRLIALATLAQHGVMLFYATTQRYHLLTWLMTFLIVTAWLWAVAMPWFRCRFPEVSNRVASWPASAAFGAALGELDRATGGESRSPGTA